MSAYSRSFGTRLFIQAAITAVFAPMGMAGRSWLAVTLLLAAAAAGVGALLPKVAERGREVVVGFEAVAVAIGLVGVLHHHYIPGTIVGVAALVDALRTPTARAAAPATATTTYAAAIVPAPVVPVPTAPVAAPAPEAAFAGAEPVAPIPPQQPPNVDSAAPGAPVVPDATPTPAPRAMTILPSQR